jgi:hypothetical protein
MQGDPSEQGSHGAPGAAELQRITERLESLARELDSEPEEERAAELVREASELAAKAGCEVETALRGASRAQGPSSGG